MANPDTPITPLSQSDRDGSDTLLSREAHETVSDTPTDAKMPTEEHPSPDKPMADVDPGYLDNPEDLFSCCEKTIEDHGINNAMMVCAGCKQIIKRFDDPKAFQAYIKFCRSRNRKIYSTTVPPWYIVIFKSYASFST